LYNLNFMKKKFKDFQHYIPLTAILIAGAVGINLFSYDKSFQVAIASGVAAAYFSWGIIHHKVHKDLDTGVILEYLLISILGLIIIFSLVIRA